MKQPKRLRLSRARGWKLPPGAVNVARPGRWGNPFRVGKHGDAARCVELFRRMLAGEICASVDLACCEAQSHWLGRNRRELIPLLRGRDLACWCALDQPCHADVLLEIANPESKGANDEGY